MKTQDGYNKIKNTLDLILIQNILENVSPFVQDDVVVENFALRPNDPSPKCRVDGHGQRQAKDLNS